MARFSPDGQRVFVGARKDGLLACWDVRQATEPLFEVRRTVQTNQRIQFDVSSCGRWLVSGDTDGVVRAWDLRDGSAETIPEYQVNNNHYNYKTTFTKFKPISSFHSTTIVAMAFLCIRLVRSLRQPADNITSNQHKMDGPQKTQSKRIR